MLCECGCGQDAGVYAATNVVHGTVKGQPKRFIRFHHQKKWTHCKQGHELTEDNRLKNGMCRTCDYRRKNNKKQREEWKSLGVCNVCGKRSAEKGLVSCSECRQAQANSRRKYRALNPDASKNYNKKKRTETRMAVLSYYSNGAPKCSCCGETILQFLCIDHINGGGTKHREQLNCGSIYPWLKKHNFPIGFQVLCHNCNAAKGSWGICPHEQARDNQLKDVK